MIAAPQEQRACMAPMVEESVSVTGRTPVTDKMRQDRSTTSRVPRFNLERSKVSAMPLLACSIRKQHESLKDKSIHYGNIASRPFLKRGFSEATADGLGSTCVLNLNCYVMRSLLMKMDEEPRFKSQWAATESFQH